MSEIIISGKLIEYVLDGECWVVINRSLKEEGYCPIDIHRKRVNLHRLSYMVHNGPILEDYIVRHTCDNPSCFNPAHLTQGTKKDNTQDMIERNRQSDWSDRNGHRSKLTASEYREIKRSELSSYKLAEIYPVSSVQIRRIKNGSRGCDGSGRLSTQK